MSHWPCAVAAPERAQQGIFNGLTAYFIDQIQHGTDRPAASLRDVSPRETLGDGVQIVDATVGIGADDRIADRGERHLGALLLCEHRLLGALALGDIRDSALVADDTARSVAQRSRVL